MTSRPAQETGNHPIELGSQVTLAATAIRLSWQRWPVLFAIFFFGVTNFLTDELSPILRTMLELLDLPLNKFVYIGLISGYLPILTTMPAAWFIERFGIRKTLYMTTVVMLVRNGFKALLFNPDLPHWNEAKLAYYIISSVAGVQVLSVYYCLPLKISEDWFSTSERSLAWTIMISSGTIGSSVASFLLPRYIQKAADVKPLFYLNIVTAIATTLIVVTCVTRSKPENPPSERKLAKSNQAQASYIKTFKKMIKSPDLMLHMVQLAIFEGSAIAVITVLQDILLTAGHDPIFVGNLMSINSIVSLIALVALSTLVHRFNNIVLICKLSTLARFVTFVIFLVSILYPIPGWFVILVSIVCQVASSWASPNFNNMLAHLSNGCIPESTLSGIITIIIIIMMNLSKIVFVELIRTVDNKSDYMLSIVFVSIISLLNTVAYLLFFKGKKLKPDAQEITGG